MFGRRSQITACTRGTEQRPQIFQRRHAVISANRVPSRRWKIRTWRRAYVSSCHRLPSPPRPSFMAAGPHARHKAGTISEKCSLLLIYNDERFSLFCRLNMNPITDPRLRASEFYRKRIVDNFFAARAIAAVDSYTYIHTHTHTGLDG